MYGFESIWFNMKDGFLEAIVRGHRAGFLTVADYNNLSQCESLDDVKLNLVSSAPRQRLPRAARFGALWHAICWIHCGTVTAPLRWPGRWLNSIFLCSLATADGVRLRDVHRQRALAA